ncbi:MAG: tetratricopeptide repeat protein, partial [bacterium]
AYEYAQMLQIKNDTKGAIQAYRYLLLGKPDPTAERMVKTELADLLAKAGVADSGAARKADFDESSKLCSDIQFRGTDLFFGRTVLILTTIKLAEGNRVGARELIDGYLPMLQEIDNQLREEKISLKYSPMAECRFLLGELNDDDGRKAFDAGDKENGAKLLTTALKQYYLVYTKYLASRWAPEAGRRMDTLVDYCQSKGLRVKKPAVDLGPMFTVQLREAQQMYDEQDYAGAAKLYIDLLNSFPSQAGVPGALGKLAHCYIEQNDECYARVITEYLAESCSSRKNVSNEAGIALLDVANLYDERKDKLHAGQVYSLFMHNFPTHARTAVTIYNLGSARMRDEQYAEALPYYKQVVEQFPRERVYVESLNQLAGVYIRLDQSSNAIPILRRYIAEVSPGADQNTGRMRLADACRLAGQTGPAIEEYTGVIKAVSEDGAKPNRTVEETARNQKSLERALFWKAYTYAALREPPDQVTAFRTQAIESYQQLIKQFPKSELGPTALSSMGTLYYLLGKPAEANTAYEQLKRDFPDAPQARNIIFARGQSLLDLGRADDAVKVFEEMFASPKLYSANQFMMVGDEMYKIGQSKTAGRAYRQATTLAASDTNSAARSVWQMSMMGLSKACTAQSNHLESAQSLEQLFQKYSNSSFIVEGNFLLSQSYAALAATQPEAERAASFTKASRALNQARRFTKEPDMKVRADLETAALQLQQGRKQDAVASYQRVLLLTDPNRVKAVPYMNTAFRKVVPLLRELNQLGDAMEDCETYLRMFPDGPEAERARAWRAELRARGISVEISPEAPAAATNKPAAKP